MVILRKRHRSLAVARRPFLVLMSYRRSMRSVVKRSGSARTKQGTLNCLKQVNQRLHTLKNNL